MSKIPWYAEGGSGRIGKKVYCTMNGKTYVRRRPVDYDKTPTDKHAALRNKFTAAHRYAQMVIADPAIKEIYRKKAKGKCSAYSKALSDYMLGKINRF